MPTRSGPTSTRSRPRGRLVLAESYEPTLLGSAGTIAANAELADGADAVIIVYADNFSDVDLKRMLAFHRSHADPFTMLLFRAPTPRPAGSPSWTTTDGSSRSSRSRRSRRATWPTAGVYVVDADAYREIAAMKAFDLGFEVLPRFVGRMRGWPWEGYHLDVGTLEALEKARRDAPGLLERPRPGRDRDPAGGLPRPRRDGDRARPLPVRPRRGPPDPRRRRRPSGGSRRPGTPW